MPLTTRFHRTIAVATGLTAALAIAAPANAADAATGDLQATPSCTDTGWKVRWALTTTGTAGGGGIVSDTKTTQSPSRPDSPVLKTFAEDGKLTGDGVFTDEQTFPADTQQATLAFTVTWPAEKGVTSQDVRATATAPTGCTPPSAAATAPSAEATPTRDGSDTGVGAPGAPGAPVTSRTPGGKSSGKPPVKASPSGPQAAAAAAVPPAPAPAAPAPAAAAAEGGRLARTGAAVATIGGGALLLFAVGAFLFVMARRRKVRFTA